MMNSKKFWISIVAALAFGLVGCDSSSTSPGGGTAGAGGDAGSGGAGGAPAAGATVTAVHLAPEVPSADDTEVAIFVNGANSGVTISYGETTGRIPLAAGTYDLGLGLPDGTEPLLELPGVELTDGDDLTVVAYRTNEAPLPVGVFVFSNSTDDLASGSGRVFVGHGANDPALDPVGVSLGVDPDCSTLIPGFEFGTTAPAEGMLLDLPEGTYQIGFDLTPDDMNDCADFGPVGVPVTPDVVSILVAVDENTSNDPGELAPELWAIVDADTVVRLINVEEEGASVTAVHLAPEVPTAVDTEVAIFVNGANSGVTISYGETTGRIPLAAGTYDLGLGLPDGTEPLLELPGVELTDGDDLTVVAYRTNEAPLPVGVFVFSNSTDDLASGSGRVFVGHGANDPALDPVGVSLGVDPDCSTLIPGFEFGTTAPAEGMLLDLPEGTYQIGFDLTPDDMNDCADFGPVGVPVTPDVVSILVAVDENTSNDPGELAPELWGIVDADTLVRLINVE